MQMRSTLRPLSCGNAARARYSACTASPQRMPYSVKCASLRMGKLHAAMISSCWASVICENPGCTKETSVAITPSLRLCDSSPVPAENHAITTHHTTTSATDATKGTSPPLLFCCVIALPGMLLLWVPFGWPCGSSGSVPPGPPLST